VILQSPDGGLWFFENYLTASADRPVTYAGVR
jgi:hypothetical protein